MSIFVFLPDFKALRTLELAVAREEVGIDFGALKKLKNLTKVHSLTRPKPDLTLSLHLSLTRSDQIRPDQTSPDQT